MGVAVGFGYVLVLRLVFGERESKSIVFSLDCVWISKILGKEKKIV